MMEKVLKFIQDGKEYVSKPFDFEAMCIINEAHNDKDLYGPLMICRAAVNYLFEGIVSQKTINSLDPSVRAILCIDLWCWYVEDMKR